MRTHLRKALALILSLLMLCTLLPLSAVMSVSAADANLSVNFNDGSGAFAGASIVAGGPDGSNCMKWTATGGWSATYTTVQNMDPAKAYVITFKAKASVAGNMGITIQNGDWGSYWNGPTFAVTTSWKDVTIEISANQYPFTKGAILFKFQDVGVAMDLWIDDLVIAEKETASAPTVENMLVNGSFEESSGGWTYGSFGSRVSGGYDGSYALQMKDPTGAYAANATQYVTVEPNTNYTLTFWAKRVSGKGVFNIYLDDGNGGTKPTTQGQNWMNETSGNWILYTINLTTAATCTKLLVKFSNESANTSGTILVDDVVLTKDTGAVTPDTPVTPDDPSEPDSGDYEDKLSYGGSSVRETGIGDAAKSGLAFRFMVSATGGQRTSENKYVEKSGKIALGNTQHTLVRFGAVLTNKKAVGTTDFTLDNVDGKGVIEIKGIYLAGLTTDEISFAVRVVDIPDNQYDREIYARPYYVYEENGEEKIVYGEVKSNNYNKAADPKSSIKILSIGHSFSKDVMETYLWNMFKEGGYDEVVIGYLYMGGCSMPKHLYNIQNNLAQYEYGKNSEGTWEKQYNVSALTALQDEEWDYVNIQSSPDYIGGQTISGFKLGVNSEGAQITLDTPMTEYECITPITDWIVANAKNKAVKTDYNMIWSFSQGSNLWSYTYHNYNQMTMYNNIITMTKKMVKPHNAINDIIPCATSIQNIRSSFMGDNFNMPDATQGGNDGYHLNDHGDYVAALTWYCHYSRDDASIMVGYTGDLSEREFAAIAEAVNNAVKSPYEVTESTYKTEG